MVITAVAVVAIIRFFFLFSVTVFPPNKTYSFIIHRFAKICKYFVKTYAVQQKTEKNADEHIRPKVGKQEDFAQLKIKNGWNWKKEKIYCLSYEIPLKKQFGKIIKFVDKT